MRHFLKKALGFSSPEASTIRADLARLDEKHKGLGAQAADYVLTGAGETVLSTVARVAPVPELQLCRSYTAVGDTISPDRRKLFLDLAPYDVGLVTRYAQVLALAAGGAPDRAAGSKHAPDGLRVLMSEAFIACLSNTRTWPRKARTAAPAGLTAGMLQPLAEAFGGGLQDAFDIAFSEDRGYGSVDATHYRQIVDLRALVMAHPDAFLAAMARITSTGRETALKTLRDWMLTGTEPFFGFALDQAGDTAKGVRAVAADVLRDVGAGQLLEAAQARLGGTVAMREGMVKLLAGIDSAEARALLAAHRETEKTARVLAAIDNALTTVAAPAGAPAAREDDATGYVAMDGFRVDVPARQPIPTGRRIAPSKDDVAALKALIDAENRRIEAYNRAVKGEKNAYRQRPVDRQMSRFVLGLFNEISGLTIQQRRQAMYFLTHKARAWAEKMLDRMPQDQVLAVCLQVEDSFTRSLDPHWETVFNARIRTWLARDDADLRELEHLAVGLGMEISLGGYRTRQTGKVASGDLLRGLIPEESYAVVDPENFSARMLWPYLAENLDVLDEALGLRKADQVPLNRVAAISYLTVLPKVPRRYFGALLEAATGTTKSGRADARALLDGVAEVDDRLVALLDDSRQAVRASAAEWIAGRRQTSAVDALKARLKKEKSEVARAAMLSTLRTLGEPIDAYVGARALEVEAAAGLKKAKFDKLGWLPLDHLPAVHYADGKRVPAEVLRWWIFLAFKLKQPGGNGLFEIYLDQLKPADAAAFSAFVFDAWVSHDTARPSDEAASAYAEKSFPGRWPWVSKWDKEATKDSVMADLRRECKAQYLNTGAASKGLIGLTTRLAPDAAAARVTQYLKAHGKRTSQASALLEMLAAKGDPVSMQAVISAATRLKQKGVQAFAGELVQKVADDNGWTMQELADRTIPTAGLDDAGILELPCGPSEKLYTAVLTEDLSLDLRNPDGKGIKGLPGGDDEATKDSRKQLSTSKKELRQVIRMQSDRLYEALCSERQWPVADWLRDFRDHPVMRKLTERAVWVALDDKGHQKASFRPTAEGEYIDLDDNDIDPAAFAFLRLAHGAIMRPDHAAAWQRHLADYEVRPLFQQFGRPLLAAEGAMAEAREITDRKGWVTDTFTVRGVATRLRYERGEAMDGGYFNAYHKTFNGVSIVAVIEFSGNSLPEENLPAALISLSFSRKARTRATPLKLNEVPDVLLSECWNDYHAMAARGAHDEGWEKKMPW